MPKQLLLDLARQYDPKHGCAEAENVNRTILEPYGFRLGFGPKSSPTADV